MEMELKLIEVPDEDLAQKITKCCRIKRLGAIKLVRPSETLLFEKYENIAQQIIEFEVREDDVWLISWPKCGSTWSSEMLWLLSNVNNLDDDYVKNKIPRFTFLEFSLFGYSTKDIEELDNCCSPRFIKTHLPVELLPRQLWTKKPKICYVARNPKDVAVSFFHHYKHINGYDGTKELFFEAFHQDKVLYSPFWKHVFGFWAQRHEQNLLFLTYEEMSEDLAGVVQKASRLLNVDMNDDQKAEVLHRLQFSTMKVAKSVYYNKPDGAHWSGFLREGKTAAWRKEMTPDIEEKFNVWTKERMKGSDFNLKALLL